ncbi:trifunctional serine/threonine-protein kinase/ATP-binding protein/sensor histidine kinase [Cupriavidus pauculus]|uniref:histidine kinase n=1 Tax=Cupriavidus pauculus TaxID=82633 RepID=A0A2N5CBJ5_9BURK|nr:AAA family ATPase [Cupriavidus pauculus]PLP99578.1 protein kinase [Cupriavidus pauculus]
MVSALQGSTSEVLWDDGERVLSRARWLDGESTYGVLLARPAADHPLPASLDRLAHEFSLRNELDDAWAARPMELLREGSSSILVLADPGGELLACRLAAPLALAESLEIAIGVAAALGKLHQCGLIHKDLKPAHILVNGDDGAVRLTGFGLASRLPRERQAPKPPETIAGTLAYMAPEQTGRMNRSIDSRSDLYSLGVTLYQMLTGALPFAAADPMEWVHCHIAKKALAPDVRVDTVPAVLSGIVMKLLAKTAEDRYQTAASVEHDLRRCLADWLQQRWIADFPLDEHGTSGRLVIPEKLYGREREVDTLVTAFDRIVKSGMPELVLVSGYSGIGKSSVVNELHKVLVPPRGIFASGKFDQYKRDIPYSTLVQAFQGLVRPLLGKCESELAHWRDALQEALEPNARLMTELIPELRLILGDPPPVPVLDPQQAQRRFLLVFRRFIGVFARAEHPLALFMDDLQWLDAATLDLLEELLTGVDLRYLMLVGAFRDNEVDATHPLTRKLQAIRAAGVKVDEIRLAPLASEHVRQLIAEALYSEPVRIEPLARLVHDKTAGNPFFVIQFLHALVEEQLLVFDHAAGQWCWDSARIHEKGYTDNVVDLMAAKLVRLPPATLQALQALACLGNEAGMATLSTVLGEPEIQVRLRLWKAVHQELVEQREWSCAFMHDRVHEAAYLLIPEASRAEAHLRIGRLLAANTPATQWEEAIFEIAGQFNLGAALITEREERERLAEYNLLAGRRAKASTAYASALTYVSAGARLLDDGCWERCHDLMFALLLTQAECEFLTGELAAADQRLEALSERAITTVERALVTCLRLDVFLVLDQSDRAVASCLSFLRHVGIDWSPHPSDEEVRREYDSIWTSLGERSVEELIDLPLMEDPAALATVEALSKLFAPAVQTDANLTCLTICKAVSLSLAHGNCDASCVLYANMGRVAGRRFGDYQAGYRFGQLGCDLVDRRGLNRFEAKTFLCFSIFVVRWVKPVSMCRDLLRRAFAAANRSGDLSYGAYACNNLNSDLLFAGEPLAAVQLEAEHGLAYAEKVGFGLVTDFINTQMAFIRTLRGLTPVFGRLNGNAFSEESMEAHFRMSPDLALPECKYWTRKLQARYLSGDLAEAMAAATQAQALLSVCYSFFEEAEYHFFSGLTHAALCDALTDPSPHLEALALHYHALKSWAENCPENFLTRAALLGGEIARIEGRILEAEQLFEQAIRAAQDSGFPHCEAIALERASRFYAARGLDRIAHGYLRDARYAYMCWGADGKVRQLDDMHPYLRAHELAPSPMSTIATPVDRLDLATVLKVSQAVSGDIMLDKLIDTVLHTAIEQAGAERGVLVVCRGGDLRIVGEAMTGDNAIQVQSRDEPVGAAMLPESILFHVLRTRESLVFDDALAEHSLADDPYVQQHGCRSVLCLPLLNRAELNGVLYLENNLAARAFSPTRIAVLKLVACQAAISLENARLYHEVAEREGRIRRLVDANIIGILVWSFEGEILEANDAFLNMLGYEREEFFSRQVLWRDLTPKPIHPESERALAEARLTGTARPFEKAYIRKDGSTVPVIVGLAYFDASQKEGVAFVVDLTERKKAEERIRESEQRYREIQSELAHANRVATMGQLTASIAHEVNQPIAATMTNAQAGLRWLATQPPNIGEVGLVLDRIVKDASRAGEVIRRIRELIRKTPPEKAPVDINDAIREVVALTSGEAAKGGATVRTQLNARLPCIEGDRVALQQVLLNLIMNALEAMSSVDDGERQVSIGTASADSRYVLVSVSDSGPGFASQNSEHAFTPFFTTKAAGLGMGLSICRSIIDAHGGELWISANHPRGAVVQFTAPACRTHTA